MKSYVFTILVLGQLLTTSLNVGGVIPNVIMAENSDEQPEDGKKSLYLLFLQKDQECRLQILSTTQ